MSVGTSEAIDANFSTVGNVGEALGFGLEAGQCKARSKPSASWPRRARALSREI